MLLLELELALGLELELELEFEIELLPLFLLLPSVQLLPFSSLWLLLFVAVGVVHVAAFV